MGEDNEIPFAIPDGFKLVEAPLDESVKKNAVTDVKKEKDVNDVFLGRKILYNWPAVGWIEGESHLYVTLCVLTNVDQVRNWVTNSKS